MLTILKHICCVRPVEQADLALVRSVRRDRVGRGRTVWCCVVQTRRAGTQGHAQPLKVSNLIYGWRWATMYLMRWQIVCPKYSKMISGFAVN
jgi:hypothetical protein